MFPVTFFFFYFSPLLIQTYFTSQYIFLDKSKITAKSACAQVSERVRPLPGNDDSFCLIPIKFACLQKGTPPPMPYCTVNPWGFPMGKNKK